jgi:hypothetical protein
MQTAAHLKQDFDAAADALPETDFARYLQKSFGEDTARNVLKIFEQMGLPAPEKSQEFVDATEGVLVFLNRYGIVMRIEREILDRINDNPLVLSPIASIPAGRAIVEICPGCVSEKQWGAVYRLERELKEQGIDFDDSGLTNVGRMPMSTALFPQGVPVVIDRPAVMRLADEIAPVKGAQEMRIAEATGAAEELYGPLQQAFSECWPDARQMRNFWSLCESYVWDGRLVAGWNEGGDPDSKTGTAICTAKVYEARLRSADRPVSSPAAAVPQSPRPQA